MKIYLAGSCGIECRTEMQRIAKELRKDYEVYCPFELKIENAWDISQEEWAQKVFDADVAAIDACDVVVLLSPGRVSTAGTNWEQGYAYAKGKPVYVIQYTNEPASLMTYCGCADFHVSVPGEIDMSLARAVRMIVANNQSCHFRKHPTSIILT